MKNKIFYSIEKNQLMAIVIFGIIGAIFCFVTASKGGDPIFGLLGIGMLFFLVFYILGWKNFRKNMINNQ